jgi:hypothetical protein
MVLIGVGVLSAAVCAVRSPAPVAVTLSETPEVSHPVRLRAAGRDVLSQRASSTRVYPIEFTDISGTRRPVSQATSSFNSPLRLSGSSPQSPPRNRHVAPRAVETSSQVLSNQVLDFSRRRTSAILPETSPGKESLTKPALLPAPSPAVLIEFDDPLVSHPEARERLTAVALDFTMALTQSGLDPASPGYRAIWDRERIVAETRFRSMYGGLAWMNHHILSHHARAEPKAP